MAYMKKNINPNNNNSTTKETVVTPTETVAPVVETVVEEVKPREFRPDDAVKCKSITAGSLGMIGIKSGVNYEWAGRGDVTEVEYQDLVAAIRSGKRHITEPFLIIQDSDFLAQFPQVEKIYSTMYSVADMEDLLINPDANTMIATIKTLPDGAKDSIKNIAATLIANGRIDSVSKIKALDEFYGTKFALMSELFK